MSKVFAVNAGSSSLKFKMYEMPEEKIICSGLIERIGEPIGKFILKQPNKENYEIEMPFKDHAIAVSLLLETLLKEGIVAELEEIKGVGHRIVQGGHYFSDSAIFNDETEKIIASLIPLAPLHNAAHLVGYNAFKKALPNVKQIAVFDTAFHQTMEPQDYMYACPFEYYEKYMVRKYGAHGTSHKYLSERALKYLSDVKNPKIISCHIGSGASLCAIKDGKCISTSMGLTPLAGVMMGTRTGDIDPSVMPYLVKCTGKSAEEIYQEFNKKSGLLGISGISNDTRDVDTAARKGDERSKLAIQMYIRRIADYIGQYYVRLGGCDLIIFSAGVGENGPEYRELVCDELKESFGVQLSKELNEMMIKGKEGIISTVDSKIKVAVIPTDEEVMIARDIVRLLNI